MILNFSGDAPVFDLPADLSFSGKRLLVGNYPVDEAEAIDRVALRPYEARVYRLL